VGSHKLPMFIRIWNCEIWSSSGVRTTRDFQAFAPNDGYKIIAYLGSMYDKIKILNCKIKGYLYNVDLMPLLIYTTPERWSGGMKVSDVFTCIWLFSWIASFYYCMVFIRNPLWLLMYCDNISMLPVKVMPDGLSLRTRSRHAQGDTATIKG
jgi:hypothetical protein